MTLSKEDAGTHPELLSSDEFEKTFDNKFRLFDAYFDAIQWVRESPLVRQIYTEIEGDTGKRYMDRGFHLVNRTGIYAVVKDSKFIPIKYTGLSKPVSGCWNFDGDYWRLHPTPIEIVKCLNRL